MKTPIFNCTPTNGEPIFANPGKFKMHCALLNGKECELILRRKTKKKSNKQAAYYWAVVVPIIARAMGHRENSEKEKEEVHGHLQLIHFVYTDGQGRKYIRSSKLDKWTTVEWEEKMCEIRQWAAEFFEPSCYIPLPNEVDY